MATAEYPATESNTTGITVQALFDKTVCYSVDLKKPGISRRADMSQIETDADKEMLKTTKQLLDCDEWKALAAFDSSVRAFFKPENNIALPAKFLKGGMYLVPLELTDAVDDTMETFATERVRLIDEFLHAYPLRIIEAQARLNSQFRASDYPSEDELRDRFLFRVRRVVFGTPGNLKGRALDRELENAEQECREALSDIRQALRASMAGLVDHLVDRLTPAPDGTRKRFSAAAIENMEEFLKTFEARNITSDDELASLAVKARAIMEGTDAEALKASDDARAAIGEKFAALKTNLDGMVVRAPSRRIELTDEE